ncbi:MAG: pyridoxamine 5'-phosphate oxidase family protein [Chloroflexi bacterium]|nr:pyridoxamine 5'-phosphate oxidase family protein [Chloroflexota bacterium]
MTEQPNPTTKSLTDVRRKDRQVSGEKWISAMLRECATATLATVAGEQPFSHVNLFAFDEEAHAIYVHTARTGRTRSNIEADGRVCFSVHEMGRLLPADTALEMSVEYASVIVYGRAYVVTDPVEARHGLQLLLDKYFVHLRSGQHYRPITDEELARTAVYRIDIEQWSGKRKQVAADFPGAFTYARPGTWRDEPGA